MPKRRDDLVARREDPDLLLLDPVSGQVKVLNETAVFIWDRCDGEKTLDSVMEEMAAIYDGISAEEIENDLVMVINKFVSSGLVEELTEQSEIRQ
jgi:hypothetical protein